MSVSGPVCCFRPVPSVDPSEKPWCYWADYLAGPGAGWVEFARIPAGLRHGGHRRLANMVFRGCAGESGAECRWPVEALASVLFGCAVPESIRRVHRIIEELAEWEVLAVGDSCDPAVVSLAIANAAIGSGTS